MKLYQTLHMFVLTGLCLGFHAGAGFAQDDSKFSTKVFESVIEEPVLPEVQFFALEPPKTMSQKVQAVLYGITIDVPPQYDHYGYDIRRYMVSVGSPMVFEDPERINQELHKIDYALKVLHAWSEKNTQEIQALEAEVAASKDVEPQIHQDLRLNKAKAQGFFSEAKIWLENHKRGLELLARKRGHYYYEDSAFTFDNAQDMKEYASIYEAQQKSLSEIHEYVPFRIMMY